ncbi:MAG: hypothetical protein K8U57_28865 [Planctomycetes bacterium]|nr:hypothetical protein [Planctomycetota bacterium]
MCGGSRDSMLQTLLGAAGVTWRPLAESERVEAEQQWRAVYGEAFAGRPRLRHGTRAEFEFARQLADRWLIVPLSSGFPGTSVARYGSVPTGYECEGALVPLGAAHNVEFSVSPADLSWTMLHTHEDHALGGPYFIRREWLPD